MFFTLKKLLIYHCVNMKQLRRSSFFKYIKNKNKKSNLCKFIRTKLYLSLIYFKTKKENEIKISHNLSLYSFLLLLIIYFIS